MIKNIRNIMMIALVCGFASSSIIAKELKIGVMDTQRIFSESSYVKDIEKRLSKEFKPRSEEVESKQKAIQKKAAAFKRDQEVLSEKERVTKDRELSRMQQDLQRLAQELDMDLRSRQNEENMGLNKIVEKVIKSIAVQEKMDLIFQKPVLLYSDDKLDITSIVLKKLEAEYKKK